MTKIGIISDTHGLHSSVRVEPCDILIHAGDCTADWSAESLEKFLVWLDRQPAAKKIFIAGNHDWCFDARKGESESMVRLIAPTCIYLNDSGCEIDGIKFWGSPVTPEFQSWAFNRKRGAEIKAHRDLIPDDTDVLITHGPAKDVLDESGFDHQHCGCVDLQDAIIRVNPKIHCFGHIHYSYGRDHFYNTTCYNASQVGENYQIQNLPHYHIL